jgi:tetratricopeptide (TPR) repeat protein
MPPCTLGALALVVANLAVVNGAVADSGGGTVTRERPVAIAQRALSGRATAMGHAFEAIVPDNPLEARLLADARDGRLDEHSLLAAALIAEGLTDAADIVRRERLLDAWARELRRSEPLADSPRERARQVLRFMHRRILCGRYEETCSDLRVALDVGRHNCVSATILFNCLAARCGLPTVAVECTAHVYSAVVARGQRLNVETTCADWFDLESDAAARSAAMRGAGREEREIGSCGLVAIVYYNRGIDLLEQRSYLAAIAANAKALRMDRGSAAARGNLLASVNNWAISEGESGHYEAAARILESGLRLAPSHELFQVNQAWIRRQQVAAQRPAESP